MWQNYNHDHPLSDSGWDHTCHCNINPGIQDQKRFVHMYMHMYVIMSYQLVLVLQSRNNKATVLALIYGTAKNNYIGDRSTSIRMC